MPCSAGTPRTSQRPGWVTQSPYLGGECAPPQVTRLPTAKRHPGRGNGVFLVSCVGRSDYCRAVAADTTYNLIIYPRSVCLHRATAELVLGRYISSAPVMEERSSACFMEEQLMRNGRNGRGLPKRPGKDGYLWTTADVRKLKRLAKDRTAMAAAAEALGRTPAAVQQKAVRSGIAFRR
jgi:hypothetical protein